MLGPLASLYQLENKTYCLTVWDHSILHTTTSIHKIKNILADIISFFYEMFKVNLILPKLIT